MGSDDGAVIVAPATPWGRAALGVVRLSGHDLERVLRGFVRPRSGWPLPPGRTRRVDVFDAAGTFDDGVAVVAAAGRSATGEPTAEITLHGNPWIVERAIRAACDAGARVARPGEFTRRAVEHGKLDLIAAEAILQIAEARSDAGLRVARAGLDGTLRTAIDGLVAEVVDQAATLEARIDHPEADLELEPLEAVGASLREIAGRARALAGQQRSGDAFVHGVRVALVGPVNAGKSSLFNALAGEARAIVHESPGTTRDVVEARVVVDGLPITLLDTAGERDAADPVERVGVDRARAASSAADAVVVVLRARADGPTAEERAVLARTADRPRVVVYNGVDLPGCAPPPPGAVPTSALRGDGVEAVVPALRRALALVEPVEGAVLVASARQRDALSAGAALLDEAAEALAFAGPTVAAELTLEALEALAAIGGATAREQALDALFARFCLGK